MELNANSISNQYSSYRSNGQFIDTNVTLLHRNATSNEYLNALDNSDNDIIRHANDLHIFLTHEIDSKDRKWWITVPVRKIDNSIEYIRILADPGANIGCVNTKWAIDRYRDYIVRNNKTHTIDTPNGKVHPEYAIYLKLPTKTGDFYRAKFVLLDDLLTPILADINMLEAFGYKFRDEIPPVFSHPAEFDLDLNIKVDDRYLVHSYPRFDESKTSASELDSDDMKEHEKLTKKDTKRHRKWNNSESDVSDYNNIYYIYKLNKIHNFDDSGHIPLIDKVANDSETIMFDESYKHSVFAMHDSDFINDYERYANDLIELQQRLYTEEADIETIFRSAMFNQLNYINNPHYYEATEEELKRAIEIRKNPKLRPVNCEYIKSGAEKLNPIKYKNLYIQTVKCIEKNIDVIAKNMYDRRTLRVQPVRLNLKPDCRKNRYNIPQYPINQDKRIAVINETIQYDNNGFWIPCNASIHNTPYTVILKKPTADGFVRARMAFDARQVNNDCTLLDANYPTPKDFDDHYSQGLLTTTLDFKGFFDCIPVHPADSEFLVVQTPLGLRRILHLSYGWKNSAANAQRITNMVCIEVGHMIGFIDDCSIRYPEEWGTKELIQHLEKLFAVCRKYNLLIHPEKFFPFALKVECLGIERSIFGSQMTVKYKKKLLAIQKPETSKQLHAALGAINYVTRYLYNHALYAYWLVRLQHECEKTKKLVWTQPAELAWKILKYLIENAPLLRRARNSGTFCMQVDGCPYGVGAVLYQLQKINNKSEWVIIDMYSRIIPKNLRNAHCSVHEGLALVWPAQHCVHYLIRTPFIISTDHKPLVHIFQPAKDLNDITRKQLYRLYLALSDFDFTIEYVPGLQNKIADQLSRFAMKIIDIVAISPDPMYNDNTKILTQSERLQLNQKYESWTRMLKRLRYNKHPTVLAMNYYNNDIIDSNKQHKHVMQLTKQWLNLRIGVERDYMYHVFAASRSFAPPLIKDLFEQSLDLSVVKDDDTIDNKIYKSIINIRCHLSNLKDIEKDCRKLKRSLQKITNAHLREIHKMIRKFEIEQENSASNSNNNDYNPKINSLQTSENKQTSTNKRMVNQVHTRSFWKKLLKNEHKYTFVQPHMVNMQDRMFYRQQFLSNIHLYRPRIDFFNIDTFRLYQESDNLCKFITDNIHNPQLKQSDKLMQKKFLDLQQNDYQIYKKILNNKFRINKNGIIEA